MHPRLRYFPQQIPLVFLFSLFTTLGLQAQDYPLLYENDFEHGMSMQDFDFTDPSAWRLSDTLDNQSMELFGKSQYAPRVRSPLNIAMLNKVKVGNFVLEVKLKQTGREYGHRDMCLFFAMKDPANFYYVHMASIADPNAHNIFIVNDEPRRNIAKKTTDGIRWGKAWNTVRIERNVETGTIKVYFNDMNEPIMEAEDTHFNAGYIGFGSFDDTGMVDNIKLWGEVAGGKTDFFRQ
ncbi:hypothetical protein [Flavilitoribacter nigricans]|uniref:DUF1080 domain-containing protein n=1 Tax=Flavilitoribacter nigricans (strain ATCC 23147 / DSM 23189 / NBRC 102662 / NCIMB 1420 / SS-2) TaxID=1122177 RepID=A0A2D0N8D5_FLAN2|nr:hypothetical protein [Flavilitoribacter nigricans]PHN04656.1 hypothetical protein CRP01_19240 [Flavilitoribacter nigricans DSM 23189 = NBRC 102662]